MVCILSGVALGTAGASPTDTEDNPYREIISRNVFSLKPPPPPPNPEDTKPPPVKITLSGITTVVGKKALMETPPPPVKPGAPAGTPPPTKQYYMLGEGQREGDIEVLAIDEKTGSVKVRNSGVEVTLTFEKDGVKLPSTAPPAVAAGAPGFPAPGGVIPPPPGPGAINPAFPGVKPTFPVRPMRSPGQADSAGLANPGYSAAGYAAPTAAIPGVSTSPNAVALPAFNTPQNQAALSQAATPNNMYTPEEQAIIMEANRVKSPFGALIPPTPLTPPNQNAPTPNSVPLPPIPGRQ